MYIVAKEEALMLIGDKPKINLGRMLCHSLDAISVIPLLFKPSNYKRADRFLVFTRIHKTRHNLSFGEVNSIPHFNAFKTLCTTLNKTTIDS